MNVGDAFYQTVHGSAGGCEALAVRMNMSAAILRNKANVHTVTNKPTLDDADRIMGLTADYRILDALAANHNRICVTRPEGATSSDMAVLELITQVWAANGEVGAEVNAALADGRLTQDELVQIDMRIYRAQQTLSELATRLKGMAEK